MQTSQIQACNNCQQLLTLLEKLDLKIWEDVATHWNEVKYNLDKSQHDIKTLLRYKRILQKRVYNGSYPCNSFSSQDMFKSLVSKISSFSFKCMCFRAAPATSTSTTTSSTTTTTTTVNPTPIYYGSKAASAYPTDTQILAGLTSSQNPASNITLDYSSFMGTPTYLWFAIPDPYAKTQYFINALSFGTIGDSEGTFNDLQTVTVNGHNYLVAITNFATEINTCTLS